MGVPRKNVSDKHWIYFPDREFVFYRVGFYSNFLSRRSSQKPTSIYTEVSYSSYRPLERRNIERKILRDLVRAEILSPKDKISVKYAVDIKYAYPLYDFDRQRSIEVIQKFLRENNIYSIGRFGSWEYFSMEDVILQAKDITRNLDMLP